MGGVIGELGEHRPDDVTIIDMEASIEHLTRGTVRHVDSLILVVEPYFRALETAGRMAPLARELGIPHVAAVANKLRSPRDEAAVRSYCAAHELDVIAAIPFDEGVTEADREGRAILDLNPTAPAVLAITSLMQQLEQRIGRN